MMRVLFLCKRSPQQRDLIERPYGRFYHLPVELAAMGHEVKMALCSHRGLPSIRSRRGMVDWSAHDLKTLGPRRLLQAITAEARTFRPDWVIGCSDAWVGWMANHVARSVEARLAVDAYDNFEAYMPFNLPLHWAWRRAVRDAEVVTAAGPQLALRLQSQRHGRPVAVIPMAADPGFVRMDALQSRRTLGLPEDLPLIGYSGGWAHNRGTHLLLDAFASVRTRRPDARLVLSGRPPATACRAPGVLSMGYLDDAKLPVLLNALDVACVLTADSAFGRFSYPAKLCEAMACGVPIVATATEPVRWMLDGDSRFLVPLGDVETFSERVLALLGSGKVNYGANSTWCDSATKLAGLLNQ